MTSDEYRQALSALNLTQGQAAKWLGVSLKTSHLYARNGPSGPAARAVGMAVALRKLVPVGFVDQATVDLLDDWPMDAAVRISSIVKRPGLVMKGCVGASIYVDDDLTAAIGLDKIRPELK